MRATEALPSGTSVRLLLADCQCSDDRLASHAAVLPCLAEAARSCGMTPLAEVGHDFPGGGHTACVLLAESHLALHTYPELSRSVIVELTVCDHLRPNRERALELARRVVALFAPARLAEEVVPMTPGDVSALEKIEAAPGAPLPLVAAPAVPAVPAGRVPGGVRGG